MQRFVHGAHAAFDSRADFVTVDDYDFLRERRVFAVVPWIMPVDENLGSARVDNSKGIASGLTFRPLADSMRDTHAWWYSDGVTEERRQRLVSGERSLIAREAAILQAWKARR
jgi:2'-hydroxyisoflavone reductase